MASRESPPLALRARGPLAVFTQPALKAERVTAPVMTPSAARGLLEAVLWKPAIVWKVERVRVLSPIRFTAFRRNEVTSKAPVPSFKTMHGNAPAPVLFADEDRAQRNTVALCDVDYVIEARFSLTARAGEADNVPKFIDMFRRRVEKGQHFHQPYLGCREFAADVLTAEDAPPPITETRPLGWLLWDVVYDTKRGNRPVFFEAELRDGVMDVPANPPGLVALRNAGGEG
jgi:CRISPR-associated protein Cas5d